MATNNAVAAVITTMYRGDDLGYFAQALDSLVAQTWPSERLRIYLHVDGPVPESHERFLAEHSARFHRVSRGATNRGLTHGLNTLIELLEDEEFVFRMDMDDLAHPERVERQIDWLDRHPDLSLIGCNSFEIDERGEIVGRRDYPETPEAIRKGIARGNAILHPAYCMRRELLTRHGIRYRELYLNEDLGFLFDVLRAGLRPGNLQERLMYWRVTADFFARRHPRRHLVEFRTYVGGIHDLFGPTTRQLYPLVRLLFRFLPNSLARRVYRSGVRDGFLGG